MQLYILTLTQKMKNKIIISLLIIANILFAIYYLILIFNSQLTHYDDINFMWELKNGSIFDYVKEKYLFHSGRFVAYFINGLTFKSMIFTGVRWFIPVFFHILGIMLFWLTAKRVLTKVPKFLLFNTVLLFYFVYVLTIPDFAIINWYCAQGYYLLAPLLIYFIGLFFTPNSKFRNCLIMFCAFVLGGIHEIFTPIALFSLSVILLFYLSENDFRVTKLLKDKRFKILFFSGLLMLLAFALNFFAPGNWYRINLDGGGDFVTHLSVMGWLQGYFKAIGFYHYLVAFYLPYYLILMMLSAVIGKYFIPKKQYNYKKAILISFTIYIFCIILSVFPNVYLWGDIGLQRNYTHTTFFTMLLLAFWGFLLGCKFKNFKFEYLVSFGLLILCIINVVNIKQDSVSSHNFKKSVENRIEFLDSFKNQSIEQTIEIEPLIIPYTNDVKYNLFHLIRKSNNSRPVLYYYSDLPNQYYLNVLKRLYGYNFEIKLKSE